MKSLKIVVVDTTDLLHHCLEEISTTPSPTSPIHIAVDIEGVALGRKGRISIIQLLARHGKTVWLIDVTTLGNLAFDGVDSQGRSLRRVLQSSAIKKYFYEVRNDSDALYNLYNVSLENVYDLQLLELAGRASRSEGTRFLNGLKRTISTHLSPPREWQLVKDAGCALFAPEKGGQYEVFEQRPLDPRLIEYCAQDVTLLFQLEAALRMKMGSQGKNWENRIVSESAKRVEVAYNPKFDGRGRHKCVAPTAW